MVPFVARVLVEGAVAFHQRELRAPGLRPGLVVLHRELVPDCLRVDAGEAFDDVQRLGRSFVVGLLVEVDRVHHQRVALPAPAGVARPLPDARRQVGAAEGDDAGRVVAHLLHDDDVVGGLEDLEHVVVGRRHHRRALVPPDQAAFLQRARVVVVVRGLVDVVDEMPTRPPARRFAVHRLRNARRDPPVRRVDDQGRAPARERLPRFFRQPDGVVVVDVLLRLAGHGQPLLLRIGRENAARPQRVDPVLGHEGREFGRLLLGQERALGQRLRAFQRRVGGAGPDPLQVGVAPGRPRAGALRRLTRRRQGKHTGGDDRSQQRNTVSSAHGASSRHMVSRTGIMPCAGRARNTRAASSPW